MDVLEVDVVGIAVAGLAAVAPQPVVEGAPVGEGKGHTVLQVVGHVGGFLAPSGVHGDGLAILAEGDGEGVEVATRLVEVKLGVELLEGVDLEVVAGTVVVVAELVSGVLPAATATVAVVVVALVAGSIAGVRGGLRAPLVGLHDVELRAVVASDLVGVTVVLAVFAGEEVTVRVLAGHADHVEGSNATAVGLTEVNVVLNSATKEVWFVELIWVEAWGEAPVAAVVVWDVEGVTAGFASAHGNVQIFW